jgi:hypothetical protein
VPDTGAPDMPETTVTGCGGGGPEKDSAGDSSGTAPGEPMGTAVSYEAQQWGRRKLEPYLGTRVRSVHGR